VERSANEIETYYGLDYSQTGERGRDASDLSDTAYRRRFDATKLEKVRREGVRGRDIDMDSLVINLADDDEVVRYEDVHEGSYDSEEEVGEDSYL